ncbi:MAG: hydrogenase [Planctomycetes bacterium]|nr:hydrogenase [Planctomycetota bacterium]
MNTQMIVDSVLVLVILLDLAMLAVSRLATCIRLFALQSLLLALLPLAATTGRGEIPGLHEITVAAGALGLKVILLPRILLRIIRTGEIHQEIEPFIGFTASVLVGAGLVIGSFAVTRGLPLPVDRISDFLPPVSAATILVGLLILISRVKAVTQVVGFLVMENGIYLFGLLLLEQTPLLVELGILLDLFVGVFIMAIVVYHIRREFDHMDTHLLDTLKEA